MEKFKKRDIISKIKSHLLHIKDTRELYDIRSYVEDKEEFFNIFFDNTALSKCGRRVDVSTLLYDESNVIIVTYPLQLQNLQNYDKISNEMMEMVVKVFDRYIIKSYYSSDCVRHIISLKGDIIELFINPNQEVIIEKDECGYNLLKGCIRISVEYLLTSQDLLFSKCDRFEIIDTIRRINGELMKDTIKHNTNYVSMAFSMHNSNKVIQFTFKSKK